MKKAVGNTLTWFVINTIFGLLPIFVLKSGTIIGYKFNYDEIVKDGVILFYCSAISASVLVDFLSSEFRLKKIYESLITGIPVMTLGVVYFLFFKAQSTDVTDEFIHTFENIQYLLFAAVFLCLIPIKCYMYYFETDKNL